MITEAPTFLPPLTRVQFRLKVHQFGGKHVVLFGAVPILQNTGPIDRHDHVERQIVLDHAHRLRVQLFQDVQRFAGAFAVVYIDLGRIVVGSVNKLIFDCHLINSWN